MAQKKEGKKKERKKNSSKNSGHFVPQQRLRAAHALRSDQLVQHINSQDLYGHSSDRHDRKFTVYCSVGPNELTSPGEVLYSGAGSILHKLKPYI